MVQYTEWRSISDGSIISSIPDRENLHANWDLQDQNFDDGDPITTIEDATENGHDLTGGDATYEDSGFNGLPAANFGGDDFYDIAPTDFETIDQPTTHYFVVEISSPGDTQRLLEQQDSGLDRQRTRWESSDDWEIFAGNIEVSGSGDSDANIVTSRFDGQSSLIREDGTQIDSGNSGSESLPAVSLGTLRQGEEDFWEGRIMQVMIYDAGHDESTIEEVESYLESRWGI